MGIVYSATDIQLHRRVALKFAAEDQDPRARHRLAEEARAASSLNHPNIAQIYDFGETADGVPFFVMELVEGRGLNDVIRSGPMKPDMVVHIAEEVCSALGEAHGKGIVHRDIKPANIFITENGRAKVLDFGIAKRAVIPVAAPAEAEPETTVAAPPVKILPTGFAGTPAYMSPEQAAGQIMDSRSDLFSLGAVLYECLTGRRPFQGTDTRETIAAIRILDPDPPSAINPEVPKSLDRIVLKLLAKKPADRYQSSEQILSDLHALQQTQLLPTELTFKPTRLSRRVLALSILLVLGLAAGGAWWLRWSNRPYVPKSEALRWYETGLRALRDGTYRSAATALARAANLDDDFLLAHARLAEAWSELEYRDEASKSMLKATPPGFNMNRLSAREALTIEAIRYTVTGDYQKSVEKYQQIVDASPATDKAWVLFDLGRAQERLNDPTGALASYRRSIALDSQNTPAYLRIGQLLTSQKKYQEAEAALKQAGDLYRDASNVEGANEALQSTALLEIQRGNFEKSETLLQKALDLAKANGNQLQQINALRLLSQVKVSQEQADAAEKYALQAIELARNSGDENVTARALMDLAGAQHLKGNLAEAKKYYQQALDIGRRNKATLIEMRALANLGSIRVDLDEYQDAVRDLEQACPLYDAANSHRNSVRARILLARAWHGLGDYQQAASYLKQAAALTQPGPDDGEIALMEADTGALCNSQGRFREAIGHYEHSYTIDKATNYRNGIGVALRGKAASFWRLGDYNAAHQQFQEAMAIAKEQDLKDDTADILIEQVKMSLSREDIAEAERLLKELDGLLPEITPSHADKDKALRCLARSRAGARREAAQGCGEILATYAGQPQSDLEPQIQLTCAEVALEAGEKAKSEILAAEAQKFYARNQCPEAAWRASLLMALSRKDAAPAAKQAKEQLAALERQWSAEDFKKYRSRPDIRRLSEKLSQIKED